jgi:hypothetical protein
VTVIKGRVIHEIMVKGMIINERPVTQGMIINEVEGRAAAPKIISVHQGTRGMQARL